MRELEQIEIDQVSAGGWAVPIAIGAATAGTAFAGYRSAGWGGAALGAVFGVGAAGAGAMIGVTAGITRLAWAARAAGWTAAGGIVGGRGYGIEPEPMR